VSVLEKIKDAMSKHGRKISLSGLVIEGNSVDEDGEATQFTVKITPDMKYTDYLDAFEESILNTGGDDDREMTPASENKKKNFDRLVNVDKPERTEEETTNGSKSKRSKKNTVKEETTNKEFLREQALKKGWTEKVVNDPMISYLLSTLATTSPDEMFPHTPPDDIDAQEVLQKFLTQ